jgi:mRNA interferase YafQ
MRIKTTNAFEKDIKQAKKRNKNIQKLKDVLNLLCVEQKLPHKYKNHKLTGNLAQKWECHIEPDWLLIYAIEDDALTLYRTGTHSDLFN